MSAADNRFRLNCTQAEALELHSHLAKQQSLNPTLIALRGKLDLFLAKIQSRQLAVAYSPAATAVTAASIQPSVAVTITPEARATAMLENPKLSAETKNALATAIFTASITEELLTKAHAEITAINEEDI